MERDGSRICAALLRELAPAGVGHVMPEELVKAYLDASQDDHAFTGRAFETYGAETDPYAIEPADLLAVTMLSIEVRSRSRSGIAPAAIIAMGDRNSGITELLARIDPAARLESLDRDGFDGLLGSESSPGQQLFERLHAILRGNGNRRVIATHKLLARKRPHLFPVRDRVVEQVLEIRRTMPWWRPWWEALHEHSDGAEVVNKAEEVRRNAGATHLSVLRVLDILIWVKRAGRATLRSNLQDRLSEQ